VAETRRPTSENYTPNGSNNPRLKPWDKCVIGRSLILFTPKYPLKRAVYDLEHIEGIWVVQAYLLDYVVFHVDF